VAKLCGDGDRPRFCFPRLEDNTVGADCTDRARLAEFELSESDPFDPVRGCLLLLIRVRLCLDLSSLRPSERDRDGLLSDGLGLLALGIALARGTLNGLRYHARLAARAAAHFSAFFEPKASFTIAPKATSTAAPN
jgi:hypothetical protein